MLKFEVDLIKKYEDLHISFPELDIDSFSETERFLESQDFGADLFSKSDYRRFKISKMSYYFLNVISKLIDMDNMDELLIPIEMTDQYTGFLKVNNSIKDKLDVYYCYIDSITDGIEFLTLKSRSNNGPTYNTLRSIKALNSIELVRGLNVSVRELLNQVRSENHWL